MVADASKPEELLLTLPNEQDFETFKAKKQAELGIETQKEAEAPEAVKKQELAAAGILSNIKGAVEKHNATKADKPWRKA